MINVAQGLVTAYPSRSVSAVGGRGSLEVPQGCRRLLGMAARSLWVWRGWKTSSAHLPLPGSVAEGQEDTILSYEPVTRQESKSWH